MTFSNLSLSDGFGVFFALEAKIYEFALSKSPALYFVAFFWLTFLSSDERKAVFIVCNIIS